MPRSAVLMMDLQTDFLAEGGAQPVISRDALRILETANAILDLKILVTTIPIFVVNQFPLSDRIGNFLRHSAAIVDTSGADIDHRVHTRDGIKRIPKSKSSAFTNPELSEFLKANDVDHIYIFGVFAEGCVRATTLEARRLGYTVTIPMDAIGSHADLKKAYARWSMRRAGAVFVPTLLTKEYENL